MRINEENIGELSERARRVLDAKGLLTEENIIVIESAIKRRVNPVAIASAISILDDNHLLTEEHRIAVSSHADPEDVAHALRTLNRANLLIVENKRAIVRHHSPIVMAQILIMLNDTGLLTEQNRAIISNCPGPLYVIRDIFGKLNQARVNLLIQRNVELIASPHVSFLYSGYARISVWEAIPAFSLTQDIVENLVRCAQQPDPTSALSRYVNDINVGHRNAHVVSIRTSVSLFFGMREKQGSGCLSNIEIPRSQ